MDDDANPDRLHGSLIADITATSAPMAQLTSCASQARDFVKVSMHFSHQTIEALRDLSRRQGMTMTEVVRRGIGLQSSLLRETDPGGRFLIEDAKGKVKRVLLP